MSRRAESAIVGARFMTTLSLKIRDPRHVPVVHTYNGKVAAEAGVTGQAG